MMKRYDIKKSLSISPPVHASPMDENPDGEYVKYEDMIAMLRLITKQDPDTSPRLAVINAVFDDVINDATDEL